MNAPVLTIVPLRIPEGLNIYLKHQDTPWIFRILPTRDPDQPRLWCLRVEPCAGASMSAQTARVDPFYTSLGMSREQLIETLAMIHDDVGRWLGERAHPSFHAWLTRVTALPIPGHFTSPPPPARVARADARARLGQPVGKPVDQERAT